MRSNFEINAKCHELKVIIENISGIDSVDFFFPDENVKELEYY